MAPSCEAYNVDWTKITSGSAGPPTNILGIGEVALPTKAHPKKTGRDAHSTLKLKDVLYMPSANCNILGDLTRDGVKLMVGPGSGAGAGKLTDVATGAAVGILDCPYLFKLRLSGQSPNQSSLDKNAPYFIRANWSDSERRRWKAHKRQLPDVAKDQNITSEPSHSQVPPYTAEEKEWLKRHLTNEFHFLRMHGYSIYDEEERAEGRLLVRALMKEDKEDDDGIKTNIGPTEPEDDDDEDLEEESSFLRELEEVPESHFADYHFSKEELEFIKKNYGYS